MITDEILNMDDDDRPPLLVIEEEELPNDSRKAPETYQKPEELVGLDPKPTHPDPKSMQEPANLGMTEGDAIIARAKQAQEEEDERGRFRSPLRGPYDA